MNLILVQMADRPWTEEALHLACAMARSTHSQVALLRMLHAQHYGWLGTSLGYEPISAQESETQWLYRKIAHQYGVELCVESMQWMTYVGAMVDASDELDAEVVFASVPATAFPVWRHYLTWDLRRQLKQRNRVLYTLDQPVQSVMFASQLGTT